MGGVLLVFAFVSDRSYIGLGTLLTIFLQGYVIDLTRDLLYRFFPAMTVFPRGVCFLLGIAVLCVSSAMYYAAGLGVSPYDAVALLLSEKYRVGKFQTVRVAADLSCVALGAALLRSSGVSVPELVSSIGPGTLLTALCMGPLVAWLRDGVFSRLLPPAARQAEDM